MKERSVLALFVCVLLITLTGVGQAQDVILPPDAEVPIEILMGVIGKYTAMVQEYQSLIDQNGVPESIVAFRLAAEVAIPDEVTGADLTSILGGISGMAYWVEATIFARHDLALSINLSGSLGNMEIVSTPDGALAIARDEAVFTRIPTEEDLQQALGLFSFEGTWPDDSISLDSDILASAEQFIAFVQESLTDAVIEYDGLEVTPRGMAHVVRITLADTGESITLWVLDETWELCKVGFDDPVSGSSAITIIKEADLVIAEIPNSAFDVDVTGLAEISYEDFISLITLNISLAALMGVPVVGDLSLSTGEVLQGEQVVVRSNGMDGEDEESALVPEFEYMPPDDSWIPLPAAHYVGVAPAGHWEAAFVPSIDGLYGFRVSYTDTNGITSNSMELFAEIAIVTAVPPQVIDVSPKDGSTDVVVSSQVTVTFSKGMQEALTQASFSLADESGAVVSGSFEWNENTLVFSPDQDLMYGQLYSAKILGIAPDLNGFPMGDDFSWGFTTELAPLPQVIDVSPKDGSTDVSVSSQVTATFSQEMEKTSTQSAFLLTGESGAAVSGSFEWNENTLVFSPDQDLAYGQFYSAKILGTAAGINTATLGDDFSWGFTTEFAPLPKVAGSNPSDGQRNVPISGQVSVTFTEDMDQASVENAFSLMAGDQAVTGSFQWADKTLTFISGQDLEYNTTYRARVAGSARSALGIGLDGDGNGASEGTPKDDVVWKFTAEAFPVIAVKPASQAALGGDFVTVDIVAEAVSRLRSFSVTVNFNPDVLSLLKVERRDFANWRPRPKFITDVNIWRPTVIDEEQGIIVLAADSTRADGISGTGALATITFRAAGVGESPIQLKDASASNVLGVDMAVGLRDGSVLVSEFSIYDANHDGVVDILDFITMQNDRGADTDVNGDGVTDILDLVAATGGAQASPGFAPTVSALGYNYPNPFNPETWIPYQLAKDANVVIRIYGAAGRLVRTLDLGYRTVGRYSTKNIAAHWDGANEAGEPVASGIYYYNIRAGAFSAVRKMVILE